MTPLPEHEYYQEFLRIVIEDIADTLEINYECLGSTTWKRERRLAGKEDVPCLRPHENGQKQKKLTPLSNQMLPFADKINSIGIN